MSFNWQKIGDKIFGILSSSGYGIQMWDKTGKSTIDPHDAIRFLASIKSKNPQLETFNILIGLHDEDAYSHLDFRTPKAVNDVDFETITNIKNSIQKNLGDVEGLKINWTPFGSTITLKDDPIEKVTESRDIGKVYGTTKSSFQNVGKSKLIVRHTDSVDESKQGSRWRKIRSVFIETKDGERFKYPRNHIAGARALARHLSEGGNINDKIAKGIAKMSEDFIKLKRAAQLLRKDGNHSKALHTRDAMKTINFGLKKISGPRGYANADSIISKNSIEKNKHKDGSKQLLTDCENLTEDDIGCLDTAANYIIKVTNNKLPNWLQPMLQTLTDKLSNQEYKDKIQIIQNSLNNGNVPNQDDIKLVVNIVKEIKNNINEAMVGMTMEDRYHALNKALIGEDLEKIVYALSSISYNKVKFPNMSVILTEHKNKIIRSILTSMKDNGLDYVVINAINALKQLGVTWPELSIFKKSIENENNVEITEELSNDLIRIKELSGI
jgi:hypothetical protein